MLASFNALSDEEIDRDGEMVKGLECNCPDNCDELIYEQVFANLSKAQTPT